MTAIYEGGCLCRTIRYRAEAAPVNERVCHCRLCQTVIGAAFNARLLFKAEDVRLDGPVATHKSSPDLERGFCPRCGATVFSRRLSARVIGLTAGTLDDPSLFKPSMHIHTAAKQPWLRLDDGLPQHAGAAPA